MVNFLSTFEPTAILFSSGPLRIYWYGLIMVLAIVAALLLTFRLAKLYNLKRETIFDLAFWLIIGGLIGARIYDDLLQLPYYLQHPLQSLEIWKGGLAIHGAILAGLLIVWWFARSRQLNFWQLTALLVPGVALGQAVGRWGNYFNQELFGRPTDLPWGIPIVLANRPSLYIDNTYFHPIFLYESLGNLVIAGTLVWLTVYAAKTKKLNQIFYVRLTALYLISYSWLRFFLEFIQLDPTPVLLNLRWPQIISLLIIIMATLLFFKPHAVSPDQTN